MWKKKKEFSKQLVQIAVPVTLQSILQASFSVIDQIMTGQLGSVSIAGIGLGGKFASIYSVVIAAVAAVAGIMIAQYMGKRDERAVGRSICTNLLLSLLVVAVFTGLGTGCSESLMGLYTEDAATIAASAGYLRIYALSFLPVAVTSILSAYLRCAGEAGAPLYASLCAVALNTGLNYVLIFGKWGFPRLGTAGAAWASVISQATGCAITLLLFVVLYRRRGWHIPLVFSVEKSQALQYAGILAPILVSEFFWSLGENVYAAVYGHIGTAALAAMTLTGCIQGLVMGALSGVSQAAGIMVGKRLGANQQKEAYEDAKRLMLTGLAASLLLSIIVVAVSGFYVKIFQVEETVRVLARQILLVYALVAPVKVQNMIIGGGVLRSGGETKYVMAIDLIGTWVFGVPLGLLAAFVWRLPVAPVYFILSLEECVRLFISLEVFRRREWMKRL
ncbi:MAG: MATE family efflux transporter [Muribaculaceae bacterium]|nr:MATE family efflux transporter [Roseburia sp.]MCM1432289.1 MATE family efflux transporter [Muribaculaceae bacterium]MCM1494093.1 MATE family efflux transporter [Muribaculaceae bacterium]